MTSTTTSNTSQQTNMHDAARPGFVLRQTASDRPGVAQPVPERDVPERPWGKILMAAVLIFVLLLGAWEMSWRKFGVQPGYSGDNSAWAEQRRRINQGEEKALVVVGSSRVLFGIQLPVWQQVTGERPVQLALEGTSALPVLEDLAADPQFAGRLIIGVAPDLFFTGFAYRGDAITYFHKESPSQRVGHWLSQQFLEPYFAFYDDDFALPTVLRREAWPKREGTQRPDPVRKLKVQDKDRNTAMWQKVETDAGYQTMAQGIWASRFMGPPPPMLNTPEKVEKLVNKQIERAVIAVKKLHARGVQMVFVRMPSGGAYYAFEQKAFPRERTWDVLLQKTGVPGIHFEDHHQLQGYTTPEWSHLSASEARRFTAALAPLVVQAMQAQSSQTPPSALAK